jgi:NAD(P)H dehydrogenase (quinone)
MKILIVYAHPEPKSFNGAMKDLASQVLQEAGHSVQISDLYSLDFDAVGGVNDFMEIADTKFFNYLNEQVRATNDGGFVPELKTEMDKVVWADFVLFQFPLWWFSFPAIMKGWIDRMFAMGFSYEIRRNFESGIFREKRAMLALTTGSPSMLFRSDGKLGSIEDILHHIHWGMLRYVGMDVLPPFVAYGAARATAEQRAAYLEAYKERLRTVETTSAMSLLALPPSAQ